MFIVGTLFLKFPYWAYIKCNIHNNRLQWGFTENIAILIHISQHAVPCTQMTTKQLRIKMSIKHCCTFVSFFLCSYNICNPQLKVTSTCMTFVFTATSVTCFLLSKPSSWKINIRRLVGNISILLGNYANKSVKNHLNASIESV